MIKSPILQISNKVWNATIKIPELKTALPAMESTFDSNHAATLLTNLFRKHKGKILVVTGAGISTDSGIPDYRGERGTYVKNPKHRPILFHELASSHGYRTRYWSRSYLGWRNMSEALPNDSHYILESLLEHGYVQNIITQNVDYLHTKAGTPAKHLLELHGDLYHVECLDCGTHTDRTKYQNRIHSRNPGWANLASSQTIKINPDGDVELPAGITYDDFDIPPCLHCGSLKMKPNVVFFGENIKPSVTLTAEQFVRNASAIVVMGSSLATYSAYKLLRLAKQMDKPIGIVTKGPTRADHLMSWKAEVPCLAVNQMVYHNLMGKPWKK